MPESLTEKTVAVRLSTNVPLRVFDDQGRVIGSAYLEGCVGVTLVVEKNHPAALDLETENGLARLKLTARVDDNVVDGSITVGG